MTGLSRADPGDGQRRTGSRPSTVVSGAGPSAQGQTKQYLHIYHPYHVVMGLGGVCVQMQGDDLLPIGSLRRYGIDFCIYMVQIYWRVPVGRV